MSDVEDAEPDCAEEKQKAAEWEEKYKRALADYANLERRSAKTIQDGIDSAVTSMARGFLDIYDDFVRARDAYVAAGSDTDGLDSILRNTDTLFRDMGVAPIESLGKVFDPHYHEAMLTVPRADLDEHTITRELRKGYIINGKVLRPALVEISTKDSEE